MGGEHLTPAYCFAKMAKTKCHKLGELRNRNVFPHISGGWNVKGRCLGGGALYLLWAVGESALSLSQDLAVVWQSLVLLDFRKHHPHLCLHLLMVFPLCVCATLNPPFW